MIINFYHMLMVTRKWNEWSFFANKSNKLFSHRWLELRKNVRYTKWERREFKKVWARARDKQIWIKVWTLMVPFAIIQLTNNLNYVNSSVSSIETDTFLFNSANFKFSTFADRIINDVYNVYLPLGNFLSFSDYVKWQHKGKA